MNFEEAEARFRELQARVQRGEAIGRAEYEEQVQQLAVQDQNGVLWEINPRTGKWMYFDGAEWVAGVPPGHDNSSVIPVQTMTPPAPKPSAPSAISTAPVTPPPARPTAPAPTSTPTPPSSRVTTPSAPAPKAPSAPEPSKPFARLRKDKPATPPPPPGGGQPAPRPARQSPLGGKNREWVPLAIGAVVLLACAGLLFFGGKFALDTFSPKPTPTRTALSMPSNTPVPTVVRLPTQPPPTATPAPVIAKIAETQVNVRSAPSTKATIITKLKKDTQITLIGVGPAEGSNVWYQVNVVDKPGPAWIRSDTLQIISGDPNTLPAAGTATPATPTATKVAPASPSAPKATPTLTPIGGATAVPTP